MNNQGDMDNIKQLTADLCHDAATPICTIQSLSQQLEKLLPKLIMGYKLAAKEGMIEPLQIRDEQRLTRLSPSLQQHATSIAALHQAFWNNISGHALQSNDEPDDNSTHLQCKVLIVDDEPIFLESFTDMFEELGCQVTAVPSGKQALQRLNKDQFDIILMDCRMPHMDGYETTVIIKEMEEQKARKTPIIGLTASPLEADREKGLHAGMCDFVVKPLELEKATILISRYKNTQ